MKIATGNARLVERARELMPGGVSSPVRAFRAVGGEPPFIVAGDGCAVRDADGREYIDLICSWGPLIAGHAHRAVVSAIREQAERGTSYGMPTLGEVELAELIVAAMPAVEMVRFVSSGTEAAMSALRLARAATGRDAILPDSAGVPAATAAGTLTVAYNDLAAADRVATATRLATIVVEPFAGNMGCVPPRDGFLEGLRRIADRTGALLVFDEVITGFRVARGGAQARTGVRPDLTCLGKIIGGGLPVGAYGGSRELMRHVAPLGPMYQAGTLSGNPLAMAAGIATLGLLDDAAYERLEALGLRLELGLDEAARAAGVAARVQRVASLLTLFFTEREVWDEDDAKTSDRERFAAFHQAMLHRGVLLPPSQFECLFLSLAHDEAAIDRVVDAAAASLKEIA